MAFGLSIFLTTEISYCMLQEDLLLLLWKQKRKLSQNQMVWGVRGERKDFMILQREASACHLMVAIWLNPTSRSSDPDAAGKEIICISGKEIICISLQGKSR